MAQSSHSVFPGPAYHYYLDPYSILSFVAGLYLDSDWSDAEFEKWKRAGATKVRRPDGTEEVNYIYEAYLDPYSSKMPAAVKEIITKQVAQNASDDRGRRAPTNANCDVVWEPLVTELTQPAGPPSGGRAPKFYSGKPVLSTLAAIYLGTQSGIGDALGFWHTDETMLALFKTLLDQRGTIGAQKPLQALKDAVYRDLTEPLFCW